MPKITGFTGATPVLDPRVVGDNKASLTQNFRTRSGAIRAYKAPYMVGTLNKYVPGGSTVKSIFRVSQLSSVWMHWLTDVRVARGPIAGDTTNRFYYTGDGEPRISNQAMAEAGPNYPQAWFVLGVPAPSAAMSVAVTAGSSPQNETWTYVYTHVNAWGEEGAPSPAVSVTSTIDATKVLSGMQAAPPNSGTISGATLGAGQIVYAFNSVQGLRVGENVTISGVIGIIGANGSFQIAAISGNNVTVNAISATGIYTSGGAWARTAPHNTSTWTRRVYRASATSTYFFVAELTGSQGVGATTWTDSVTDSAVGGALTTLNYNMPDPNMQGLIALPNGMMAGYVGNQLCLSVPYLPYAWPIAYRLTTDTPIQSIGSFNSSIVIGTQGQPFLAAGTDPSQMTMDKIIGLSEPCASTRGMVSTPQGVVYAGPTGFILVGPAGFQRLTDQVLDQETFKAFPPSSIFMAPYQGDIFYWFGSYSDGYRMMLQLDMTVDQLANLSASASWTDPFTGENFIAQGGNLYQFDAHPYNLTPFTWRSKIWDLPGRRNFAAAAINADYGQLAISAAAQQAEAAIVAANAVILAQAYTAPNQQTPLRGAVGSNNLNSMMLNGSILPPAYSSQQISTQFLTFRLYADGVLKLSYSLSGNRGFSLPSGFKAKEVYFEVSGTIDVHTVRIAESMARLAE